MPQKIKRYTKIGLWWSVFCVNVSGLVFLAGRLFKIWTNQAFTLPREYFEKFPNEPEFASMTIAKEQLWFAVGSMTFLYLIGGYLCYDFLIKPKKIKINLISLFVIAFIWMTGEAIFLSCPALDKAITIQSCQTTKISKKSKKTYSWNKENHYCNLLDAEKERMRIYMRQKRKNES